MMKHGNNTMKHSIKNQIVPTKAVYFSPLKSRALVDFSLLKSGKHIKLLDFTTLKSSDPVGFQGRPILALGLAPIKGRFRRLRAGSCELGAGTQAASWRL